MVLLKLEGVRALAPMGVQVADDRLDEVSCGAVASHVSSPYLQPPTAKAVGKKREPMKEMGRMMRWRPRKIQCSGERMEGSEQVWGSRACPLEQTREYRRPSRQQDGEKSISQRMR